MTQRISPDLADTELILEQLLPIILAGNRASLLVPHGGAYHMCARIRTMISRKRRRLMRNGTRPKRFKLVTTTHNETHNGVRMECIVFWREYTDTHYLTQVAEDLLSNA